MFCEGEDVAEKKNTNRGFVRSGKIVIKTRKSDSGEGVSAWFSLIAVSASETVSALVLFCLFAFFGIGFVLWRSLALFSCAPRKGSRERLPGW